MPYDERYTNTYFLDKVFDPCFKRFLKKSTKKEDYVLSEDKRESIEMTPEGFMMKLKEVREALNKIEVSTEDDLDAIIQDILNVAADNYKNKEIKTSTEEFLTILESDYASGYREYYEQRIQGLKIHLKDKKVKKDHHLRPKKKIDFSIIKKHLPIWIATIIVIIVLSVLLFPTLQQKTIGGPGPESDITKTYINKTVTISKPVLFSYQEYLDIKDYSYKQEVSLKAHLKLEVIPINNKTSMVNNYIMDDYNKTIKLLMIKTNEIESGYFLDEDSDTKIYDVKGVMTLYQGAPRIDVRSITPSSRQYDNLTTTILEEVAR